MDEAVIKYYRRLLNTRFEHAGSLENASIFLDAGGEKVLLCGNAGDFLELYINVVDDVIDDIKYLCFCDPTANVAVEILCTLLKGKTIGEAAKVTEQSFHQFIGTVGEELGKKAKGLLELFNRGITRYRAEQDQ